jgi:hypothetical protein
MDGMWMERISSLIFCRISSTRSYAGEPNRWLCRPLAAHRIAVGCRAGSSPKRGLGFRHRIRRAVVV